MGKKVEVDQLLSDLNHPLTNEIQSVRQIIKGVNSDITETWKWSAPSFSYKDNYLVTFYLRPRDRIHLVFHHPRILEVESSLLEGDYINRRMLFLKDMKDIKAKKPEIERIISDLIKLQ